MGFRTTSEQSFQIFQDSNKVASEYARHAISFSFYLNGAAATAILASGKTDFYSTAISLGFGAAFAVISMGLSYIYEMLVANTWKEEEIERNNIKGFYHFVICKNIFISNKLFEILRLIPILFWLFSVISFFTGLFLAISNLQ